MTWGNPDTLSEKLLAKLLLPASYAWGAAAYCRLMAYNLGVLKQQVLPIPVVSIGNITCGGTGKTPVTIDLARHLVKAGAKPAIISRGYKRRSRERFVIVSDGQCVQTTPSDSGDEPFMMAHCVPEAVVIVGAERSIAAEIALRVYGCDIVVLDDAFQHFSIARNQDVVLLDYNDNLASDTLLPAGRLREPAAALTRANWVVVTKVPTNPDQDKLKSFRTLIDKWAPNAFCSSCRFVPDRLHPLGSEDISLNPQSLSGVKVLAVSGVARPKLFFEQLQELGANVVSSRAFADHHWYHASDIELLKLDLARSGAEVVVTTQKDSVRLNSHLCKDLPVSVLTLRTQWLGPIPLSDSFLTKPPSCWSYKIEDVSQPSVVSVESIGCK